MIEAGGVLDPFSAFTPIRISSTSKQEAFFNSDSSAKLTVAFSTFGRTKRLLMRFQRLGGSELHSPGSVALK
ncbi:hypothetical protein EJB05_41923 [Eragrostis curvula]|uniref:Uncharacterized protein n=1 Tax=Eragrostis curvula TaxID=38414 RepID=A0A5J9TBY7_9POAL|nr:hypothetical protein EJB05_41923 [Eragrostis curvula]